VGSYILDKRDFNLAFISIGVDYFQVLALFASADVRWPAALKTLFRMLSFFNLNLDIAAPECLVPEFKYEWKFYGTLLMPLVSGVVLIGSTVCKHASDRCIMGKKKTDKFYCSKMIGVFMLLMYYLYLMTARSALQIFNCNPSEPDDGFLYTQFADEECDGGMCRCNDPNHIQVRLILPAVLALLIYTTGFPVLVFFLLRRNKRLVKEDQLLRTLETGDTPGTNKNAYHIRRKYHKLYYHFKPGKWYWIVIIIMRKAGIVVAGLMFRANPGFQLSLILLVLFSSYVVQVKHQPYMSTAQRKEVILDHQEKAKNGHPLHVGLAARIREAVLIAAGGGVNNVARSKRFHLGSIGDKFVDEKDVKRKRKAEKKKRREYFWDYNTVEQVLLSCGIFVCLSGVMFESDRFTMEEGNSKDEPGKASFEWQREVIVYAVMAVVIFSFVFYFSVFFSEALGITPNWVKKCFAKKHKTHIDELINMGAKGGNEEDMSMNMNPLQKQMLEREAAIAAEAASALALSNIKNQAAKDRERHELQLQLFRRQSAQNRGKVGKKNAKKNKKALGLQTTASTEHDNYPESGDDEIITVGAQKRNSRRGKKVKKEKKDKKEKQPAFKKHTDRRKGKDYYSHIETGETVWKLPEGAKLVHDKNDFSKKVVNIELGLVSSSKEDPQVKFGKKRFSRLSDPSTGKEYYCNEETGETSWNLPKDAELIQ
jgi:hypothetical protein